MQVRRRQRLFPSRLRPCCVVVLSLISISTARATTTGSGDVEFNDVFLRQPGGGKLDVSRFNRGNVPLPGTYRADLQVNGAWVGMAEITLRQAGNDARDVQPCFDRMLIERAGVDVTRLPAPSAERLVHAAMADCVTLPELVPGANAAFDNGELRLDLSVPQSFLSRSARGYVDPRYWDEGVTAARLAYNANVYHTESTGVSSTQGYLGLNAGINIGPWRFRHYGSLSYDAVARNRYQSVQTSVQRSITPMRSQLVVGDAFTDGAMFDSFGFRGVQFATDDRMLPESQRGYAPTVRGIANSNARVQVRQNGNIIYETTVAPGTFEIDDLYATGYGGDLEVLVTEADGSVRASFVPYAPVVNALRPGIWRYSVTSGQYRNTGVQSTPLFLQATVQHGISNLLTGYGGMLAAQGYFSIVLGMAMNTRYGAFGADATHATTRLVSQPDRSGQSMRLSYSKMVSPTRTNVTLAAYRYSTSGFLNFADAVATRSLDDAGAVPVPRGVRRGRLQVTISQGMPAGYGNVYLSGSAQDYWNHRGRDTQYQAGYNNSYKRVSYGISAARQINLGTARWENRVMLTVGIPLGRTPHAPYAMTSLQKDSSGVMGVQESLTGTLGADSKFTYGLNASHSSGGGTVTSSVAGNAGYVSPIATLTANASHGNHYSQYGAGISGGIVAYAGGVTFSSALGDTVAIVEAADATGAHVANANGLRLDPWGHAIVPNLMPFSRNPVEIDPKGLPLDVELRSTLQQVAPTSGAVVRVRFDTGKGGRAAILRVRMSDGTPLPFAAEVFDADGNLAGTVGQDGQLLARGLTRDAGVLTAKWGPLQADTCAFRYALPASTGNPGRALPRADGVCGDHASATVSMKRNHPDAQGAQ
ncbi:fimbria/pilus outer membrane usher protein [Cupriavidus pinatubonensis]|uniref:fimbria/pilus outer membrane usher protein n=1 Tax=Cupriavidus pinatubonensis TaxID=248026 RepID=UPI001125F8D7|nr:fimbria/pilus outer membrane usher protein [Cupriavidus pinatubonensis]TPQ32494.1 fimbrial biogenesis outer membrane usher protein [Cupriavidus pinatubonensis]